MEYKTWVMWQTLLDSKMMSTKLRTKLVHQVSEQKLYSLRETAEGLTPAQSGPRPDTLAYYLYTAEYVRGWMYVFTQNRKLRQGGEGPSSLSPRDAQNLISLGHRYPVNEAHIAHPELFTFYEVAGVSLSDLQPITSKMTMFEYHGPTPKIVREIALATFSMQMAELLH